MPKSEPIVQREVARAVEEWLLSILHFAITLDEVDRAAVLLVAADIDRRDSGFTFFVRTSVKVCDAIVAKDRVEAATALRVFARGIDNVRLRRAFESVLDIKTPGTERRLILARNREELWKGLSKTSARTGSWR